jgi:hypothetical protein
MGSLLEEHLSSQLSIRLSKLATTINDFDLFKILKI